MRREDVCDVLKKIPEADTTKIVLVMRHNAAITIDALARFEEDYVVVRGREAGTNDEGRAFFVPFEDVLFIRLDRIVTIAELKRMYGEKVADEQSPTDPTATILSRPTPAGDVATPTSAAATPAPALDPAGIAKQNLLARIRAVRSGVNPVSTS